MQEFTQRNSVPPEGQCPSAEDLAAYIDGELGEAERQRITEHLASCEECYAVYTETLRFQLDTEPAVRENEREKVVRFPSREEPGRGTPAVVRRWLPIAALLLVGVGSCTYFLLLAPPPELEASQVTSSLPNPFPSLPNLPQLVTDGAPPPLPNSLQTDQPLWLGPTYRGDGDGGEEVKLDEASFRMGVQFVNLQATLQARKVKESQDVISRILNLLKPQPFTDDLYKRYAWITTTLDKRPPEGLLTEASRLAKESREVFDSTPLDLGQWVEAGRLAALSHNPSFFQRSDTQSFLRRLLWRDKLGLGDTKLNPVSRESLDQISAIVSKDDLQASDYVKLKDQFDKILGIYYPET